MPIYEVECKKCGKKDDIFRKVADYNDLPLCCETKMNRIISASFVHAEFASYKSMITGEMITDRGQHRRHLINNGCTEVGNESMEKKPDYITEKKQKHALRCEISQKLDTVR